MELEQLQDRWRLVDEKLDRLLESNAAMLRRSGTQGARRRAGWLALGRWVDVGFSLSVALAAGSFLGDHASETRLALPAAVVLAAAVLLLIDNARQLHLLAEVAWDGPVAEIQRAMGRLRLLRIRQFRWIILLAPLVGFCGLMIVLHALFERLTGGRVAILDRLDQSWLVGNLIFGVAVVPIGLAISRAMGRRWEGRPFWTKLLDDVSGRSLAAARRELGPWDEPFDRPSP